MKLPSYCPEHFFFFQECMNWLYLILNIYNYLLQRIQPQHTSHKVAHLLSHPLTPHSCIITYTTTNHTNANITPHLATPFTITQPHYISHLILHTTPHTHQARPHHTAPYHTMDTRPQHTTHHASHTTVYTTSSHSAICIIPSHTAYHLS